MSIARQLYQLQEVDLELAASEQALAGIMSQLGESQAVAAARNRLAGEQQRLEELRAQQRSAEWEIDDLRAKLVVIEGKLYSGQITSPKELANLQREVEGLRDRCNRVEDKALGIMEQVSEAEELIATLGSELENLEGEWQNSQRQLSAEAERHKAIIAELEQKRQLLVAGIDPQAVSVYYQAQRQRGRAVAKVEQGTCRGCGISLSTAQLQQARGERLVQCASCGRILFFA
jgi:predicted  nucleic acid-binding Zn-ribbon protein